MTSPTTCTPQELLAGAASEADQNVQRLLDSLFGVTTCAGNLPVVGDTSDAQHALAVQHAAVQLLATAVELRSHIHALLRMPLVAEGLEQAAHRASEKALAASKQLVMHALQGGDIPTADPVAQRHLARAGRFAEAAGDLPSPSET